MSMDERKIPKIVLKCGPGNLKNEFQDSIEIESSPSSYLSQKSVVYSKEFHKIIGASNSIPFSVLLKKVNQNSYKSIENVLELIGRMNDIEKKKTLFQIVARFKEMYSKLCLVFEWTRVSNEHLALKYLKFIAETSKNNLIAIPKSILHGADILLARKQLKVNFKLYQDLILSDDQVPSYSAPSINALAPASNSSSSCELEKVWIPSMNSLIRIELCKQFINTSIPKNDFRVTSIDDGSVKLIFLDVFEFEFTLVPSIDDTFCSHKWFIIGVKIESLHHLFKNSLTGIFQFKHNNKSSDNLCYFKNIYDDCLAYVYLFYFEELYSQFTHLSHSLGLCLFQKSPKADWFQISPWWWNSSEMELEGHVQCFKISFGLDKIFHVDNVHLKDVLIPHLTFNSNEALNALKHLFEKTFIAGLKIFFEEAVKSGTILYFEYEANSFKFTLGLLESLTVTILINPVTKQFRFFLNHAESLGSLRTELERILMSSDSDSFTEATLGLKRDYFVEFISMNTTDWVLVNSCNAISSKTDICLLFRSITTTALSLRLDSKLGTEVNFWSLDRSFQSGFLHLKFVPISQYSGPVFHPIPKSNSELLNSLTEIQTNLSAQSSKFLFLSIISNNFLNGQFVNSEEFQLFSFGLPNCISKVSLLFSASDVTVFASFSIQTENSLFTIVTSNYTSPQISNLILDVKAIIRFFSIFEYLHGQDIDSVNLLSVELPFKFSFRNVIFFCLQAQDSRISVIVSNRNSLDIENLINSESDCDIYSILDRMMSIAADPFDDSGLNQDSTDLNWLSDSFM